MSLTTRVLLGLILGLAAGIAVAATGYPPLVALVGVVEPAGTLWLNSLRMTVIPLVMSLLVTGIASASEAAAAGRVAARTLLVIGCMLAAAGAFAALASPMLMGWFPLQGDTVGALRSTLGGSTEVPPAIPGFGAWVTGLVPANPIEAAAEGAMLPLVVFSLLLGLAATRLAAEQRGVILGFFRAVGEAMMVIVGWVLRLAPVGVFALVFPLAAGAGIGAIGALGHYLLLICALSVVVTIAIYPATALVGVSVRRFAGAAAPAQAVAFSTSSSLASLPAMLDGTQKRLGIPASVSGLVLPLAVSLLRISSPVKGVFGAVFAAQLFGIALTPATLAAGAVVAVAMSLGSVGLPGGVMFMAQRIPVFTAMGVPIEVLGPMLAVEPIPDTFGTVANVTADVAATAIVAHGVSTPEDSAIATSEIGDSLSGRPAPVAAAAFPR